MRPRLRSTSSLLLVAVAVSMANSAEALDVVLPRDTASLERLEQDLRRTEDAVSRLTSDIYRAKERLMELHEGIGIVCRLPRFPPQLLEITHVTELGASLRLVRATYVLDGTPILVAAPGSGALVSGEPIFRQGVLVGSHRLFARLDLKGQGSGPLEYLDGLELEVQGSFGFDVRPDSRVRITATLLEQSDLTLPFERRPTIRFTATSDE